MKNILAKSLVLGSLSLFSTSCEQALDAVPLAELAPGNVLNNEKGLNALLNSAYSSYNLGQSTKNYINLTEVTTDLAFNSGGGENRTLSLFIDFTWDPTVGWIQSTMWAPQYRSIRDCNILLENIDNSDISESSKNQIRSEAKFLRAAQYTSMYNWFGPVPLRTHSTDQETELGRATDEEMLAFIEKELTESISGLPDPGEEFAVGKATKAYPMAYLAKHYLNTKQWEKAANAAKQIMDLGYFELYPIFKDMFKVENEGNKEMVVVWSNRADRGYSFQFANGAFPPGFESAPNLPEYVWQPSMANWATQYRLTDMFVDSFEAEDARLVPIVQTYKNRNGATINLRVGKNNSRSLKFFDPAAIGNFHGNDFPVFRYAEILLIRAEALNELNGPNSESIGLVNQIRNRAGLLDISEAETTSKEAFRDIILMERGHEFYSEGKRLEDLKRMNKFIPLAKDRGIANATDFRSKFPIPQAEINANKSIQQNEGY